jgi:uncharacterized membrane protein SpoIIM required for sporulation
MKNLIKAEWIFFQNRLSIIFGWLVVIVFVFTCLFYLAFRQNPEVMEMVWKSLGEKFQEAGLISLIGQNPLLLAGKIFWINFRTTSVFLLLGFLPFFLGAFLFVMTISALLGVSLALTLSREMGFWTFLKLTAPHGVFEIVGVIYGVSVGVYLSREMTKKLFARKREGSVPFVCLLKTAFGSYFLVVAPLLAIGAFLEAFVTPLLK